MVSPSVISQVAGLYRTPNPDVLLVYKDLSAVRLVNAVDDLHQGGFACTVLAAQHVHRPFFHRKVDLV